MKPVTSYQNPSLVRDGGHTPRVTSADDNLSIRKLERLDYTEAANVSPTHTELKKPPSRWQRALYFWVHSRL